MKTMYLIILFVIAFYPNHINSQSVLKGTTLISNKKQDFMNYFVDYEKLDISQTKYISKGI